MAQAGVVFFDSVTTTHTPVYLKVLTKGILFAEGGRLVDLYSEDQKLGRVLSGGDGYGFMKLTPADVGLKTFIARMDGHSDSAYLLVMKKTDRALLFEIEVLSRDFLSNTAVSDTQKALKILSKKFKLIYLVRFLGPDLAKKIIAKNKYPASAVLPWQGPDLFKDLKSRRITLTAIIGSADIVSEAADEVPQRFTFDETEDETSVESWQEIIKHLQ
ncbi:MAG: hypothetical protein P1P89_16885 [Desulfobacterales bacterium]|nr:hypothetical protein [Desulfobacterales bacterium]